MHCGHLFFSYGSVFIVTLPDKAASSGSSCASVAVRMIAVATTPHISRLFILAGGLQKPGQMLNAK
jgi:hypothetical protein